MKVNNILETIGKTPVVKINKLYGANKNVFIKLERTNPGNSIKDRIALAMIEDAEAKGLLKPDSVIIEPTSGNTGIGLALVAAVKGYKVILVMPESMSVERRKLMEIYGAEFDLTPREKGMKGAIERAAELVSQTPNAWSPSQFVNPANVEVHQKTTGQEILADFPDGLDYIITGVGTGGTSTVVLNNVLLNTNAALNAPGNGGGLHITGFGTVTVNGGTVNNNTAGREGGGLWNDSGLARADDILFPGRTTIPSIWLFR